tara:strand:+ start:917 stop:1096 length:180 start_codon:yes stop_codon:yes gene_type:complete
MKDSAYYSALKTMLESNLKMIELAEHSPLEDKEFISHLVLKGIIDFAKELDKGITFTKS